MTLPTKSELLSMDYSFGGEPFAIVVAKDSITLDGMDVADGAQPAGWGAAGGGGGPPPSSARPQVFTVC